MKKLPALSPAEQALMHLVWKHAPIVVSTLLDLVNDNRPRPISRNTLQTQISRLEAKGWLKSEEGQRARLYLPAIPEDRGRNTILTELRQRIFGGSGLMMVRCLVEQGGMSKNEVKELSEWIESHRKER